MLLPAGASAATKLDASQERLHFVPGCSRDARHRHRHAFQHERLRAGQPRRRLFFRQTPGGLARRGPGRLHRGGVCRLPFLAANLVDLVRPRGRRSRALFRAPRWDADQWFAPLGWIGPGHLSALRSREDRGGLFSRLVVRASRKGKRPHPGGFCHSVRGRRDPLASDCARSRSRHDCVDRCHDVRDHVRRRDESGAARFAFVRRPGAEFFSSPRTCRNGWAGSPRSWIRNASRTTPVCSKCRR